VTRRRKPRGSPAYWFGRKAWRGFMDGLIDVADAGNPYSDEKRSRAFGRGINAEMREDERRTLEEKRKERSARREANS
jgi:hypothetical protein